MLCIVFNLNGKSKIENHALFYDWDIYVNIQTEMELHHVAHTLHCSINKYTEIHTRYTTKCHKNEYQTEREIAEISSFIHTISNYHCYLQKITPSSHSMNGLSGKFTTIDDVYL